MINAQELGREMMNMAGDLRDDRQCCDWARVGQILTQLGTPKMPRSMSDMRNEDKQIAYDAAKAILAAKVPTDQ